MKIVKATFKNAWPYQQDKMNLPVKDLETALPFYETTMGFQVVAKNSAPNKSAILGRDDIQIGLTENGGDPTQDGCFFEVDNVESALTELKAKGLKKEISDLSTMRHGETPLESFLRCSARRPLLLYRRTSKLTKNPRTSQAMTIEIRNNLTLNVYGFSGTAIGKDYAGTAFKLMDKMWLTVKSNNLKNKGMNTWVYEPNEKVFAGVELEGAPSQHTGLELKSITLKKYAYYKHVGLYGLIKQAGQAMQDELKKRGLAIGSPYVEIYGHWIRDETKLETELLMCLV